MEIKRNRTSYMTTANGIVVPLISNARKTIVFQNQQILVVKWHV